MRKSNIKNLMGFLIFLTISFILGSCLTMLKSIDPEEEEKYSENYGYIFVRSNVTKSTNNENLRRNYFATGDAPLYFVLYDKNDDFLEHERDYPSKGIFFPVPNDKSSLLLIKVPVGEYKFAYNAWGSSTNPVIGINKNIKINKGDIIYLGDHTISFYEEWYYRGIYYGFPTYSPRNDFENSRVERNFDKAVEDLKEKFPQFANEIYLNYFQS